MDAEAQAAVDAQNSSFWNELCGSGLARALGIDSVDPESLTRFDDAYMALYPYLARYLELLTVEGRTVLEIGLGFGTVGELLAQRAARYHGLDLAEEPVAMMRQRLSWRGLSERSSVVQGSALTIPWDAESFDVIVSIGCLHHTGNIQRAVHEVHRVLRPGGVALIMLYNKHSFRQLVRRTRERTRDFRGTNARSAQERMRALYDTNEAGEAAPHTDYVSRAAARKLFAAFASVSTELQNFDTLVINPVGLPFGLQPRPIVIARERLLGNVARVLGLDFYIHARK